MLRADDVANFLRTNPAFFEQYAELLAQIVLPHPHGGRAISITERQILSLRERAKQLEGKLAELIRFGEENDAIGEKVHQLACALIGADSRAAVLAALYARLGDDFAVPHVALRLWRDAPGEGPEFDPVDDAVQIQAHALESPACGPAAGHEAVRAWFGEGGAHLRSLALVPLREGDRTFGLLALGSEDEQRFYADMGTLFLARIGELAAGALARVLR